jgi:CheY-like chemotaxis protein/nucleotide-binding universal stress UspA family protein
MTSQNPSILVVDDEVDSCRNLSDILTDLGYMVEMAHDGATALELVRRRPYDVALLDLMMPGMDGLSLYRAMKQVRAGIAAFLVTAYPNSPKADEAVAAGVWKVVPKPVEVPGLLQLVDEALGQPLVLVIDDDPDLCANLWDLLHAQGYRVCVAHDGRGVTQRLSEGTFHVVLLDMRLPDTDGAAVFQMIRQTDPQARVVLITGYGTEVDRSVQQLLAEGGARGVRKAVRRSQAAGRRAAVGRVEESSRHVENVPPKALSPPSDLCRNALPVCGSAHNSRPMPATILSTGTRTPAGNLGFSRAVQSEMYALHLRHEGCFIHQRLDCRRSCSAPDPSFAHHQEGYVMLAIRTVLHPSDFSESSEFAFRLACSLAHDYGARLIVLHVVEPALPVGVEGMMVLPPPGIDLKPVRARLEHLRPRVRKIAVEHELVVGDPAAEILRVAKERQCDLILMGTHGRTGIGRFLMGSVAEQVLRRAPCPVVTAKAPLPQARPAGEPVAATAGCEAGVATG